MANFNNPLSFLLRKNCFIILLNVYNNWGKQWNTTRCQQLTSIIKNHHCQYQKASFLSDIEFLVHEGYLGTRGSMLRFRSRLHHLQAYRTKTWANCPFKGCRKHRRQFIINSSCHIWSIYQVIYWAVLPLN